MIITKNGVTIRMSAQDLRVMGRNTQGVRLINLRANDEIAALAVVEAQEETPISAEHEEPKPDQEPNV
jgi:DNA gyrase subunit A